MPWLAKNSARKRTGKLCIWRGSADHTAEACGTISRSTNCAREAVAREELGERVAVVPRVARAFEQPAQLAVEAQQVEDHALEARAEEVARLAEQAVRRAGVLEVLVLALDREAHVRRLARDAEPVEQPREVRVVAVVHHDEAGVDVMGLVLGVYPDRVRVPARRRRRPRTRRSRARPCSRCAATSPETPAPTIAILIAPSLRDPSGAPSENLLRAPAPCGSSRRAGRNVRRRRRTRPP